MISSQQAGNTLLEVLVSMSLLMGGVLAYFQLDTKLISNNSLALYKNEATHILEQQIALLAESKEISESGNDAIEVNMHSYDIQWSVLVANHTKTVNVEVSWPDKHGDVSDQTRLSLSAYFPPQDRMTLALLPPPTPIHPTPH